jgi:hypothetical protein
MEVMRTCAVLVAVALSGCKFVVEEVKEDLLNDKGIIVSAKSPLVTGELGYASLADECTEQTNSEECDTDTWTIGETTCTKLFCMPGGPSQLIVTADITPGIGTISMVAINGDLMKTVGASVSIAAPTGALPQPYCSNRKLASPPYLVPTGTEITMKWDLELDGMRRYGDTGEVLVDAPGFTLVHYAIRTAQATFATPATPGIYPVQATIGDASFEYTVFDANALTLDVTPLPGPSQAPNSIEYYVIGSIDGVPTCDDPGKKTITSETPDVCLLRKWFSDQPTAVVETAYLLYVTPQAVGTCRLSIALADSTVTRTFVAPL